MAQLAASEAAARRELEEMAAQLLRETDMAMAMADSLGTEIPENFAAQRLQFVEVTYCTWLHVHYFEFDSNTGVRTNAR